MLSKKGSFDFIAYGPALIIILAIFLIGSAVYFFVFGGINLGNVTVEPVNLPTSDLRDLLNVKNPAGQTMQDLTILTYQEYDIILGSRTCNPKESLTQCNSRVYNSPKIQLFTQSMNQLLSKHYSDKDWILEVYTNSGSQISVFQFYLESKSGFREASLPIVPGNEKLSSVSYATLPTQNNLIIEMRLMSYEK